MNSNDGQVIGRVDQLASSVKILMEGQQRHEAAIARSNANFAELKDLISRALPSPSIRKLEKIDANQERYTADLEKNNAVHESIKSMLAQLFPHTLSGRHNNLASLLLLLQGIPHLMSILSTLTILLL